MFDDMRVISLQSGSNGNCVFVEAAGKKILIDAGISGLSAHRRLEGFGIDIRRVDALLISHDHRDHVSGAGIFQRKFAIPLYCTDLTLRAAQANINLGPLRDVRLFRSGQTLHLGELAVHTISTPHDAADGVGFVFDDGLHRVGVLTDLGTVFDGLAEVTASLDGLLIESNYDPDMLDAGPYPRFLKQRIAGPRGHLSNIEAAELVRTSALDRLRWLCLGHLSQENNCPELALRTHRDVLGRSLPIHVAGRHAPSDVMTL